MRGFLAETLEMAQKNKIKKIFPHIDHFIQGNFAYSTEKT